MCATRDYSAENYSAEIEKHLAANRRLSTERILRHAFDDDEKEVYKRTKRIAELRWELTLEKREELIRGKQAECLLTNYARCAGSSP